MGLDKVDQFRSQLCRGEGLRFAKTTSLFGPKFCSDIPDWLLIEVLIRFPVKLVFRCKLVCKHWLSVITDPFFYRIYVSQASLSPRMQNWTFLFYDMHIDGNPSYELLEDAYSRDLKCPTFSMVRCPFITHPSMRHFMIVGVSNGLVLCVPRGKMQRYQIYNIYNPITRQWISLPPYVRHVKFQQSSLVTLVENGVLSCYRVVRCEFCMERKSRIIRFEVFLSESNEWKGFDVCMDLTFEAIWGGQAEIELDGILHWMSEGLGIMAYDAYQNLNPVRFVALPCDSDPTCNGERRHILSICDAHLGCLRYFEVCKARDRPHGFSSFSVWILSDYSTGYWCLQHRIHSTDIIYDCFLLCKYLVPRPIYFHPFDPEIVFLGYGDIILSYNFKTRRMEACINDLSIGPGTSSWWSTIFLLVIPPWPVSINL